MSDTQLITFPAAGDKTLLQFYEAQARELKDAHHEVLNELARALGERGWVQPIDAVVERIVDQWHLSKDKIVLAIDDLIHRRLLAVDGTHTRFTGFLGNICFEHTPHRAHLANGIDVFVHGGMELLTINSTLLKPVDVFTICPITRQEIRLHIDKEQITSANVNGVSGFLADWDGVEPLSTVAARSPLFADDAAASQWLALNPGVRGTEIPGDLFLWVGMEAARQLGALRFKLIGHHD